MAMTPGEREQLVALYTTAVRQAIAGTEKEFAAADRAFREYVAALSPEGNGGEHRGVATTEAPELTLVSGSARPAPPTPGERFAEFGLSPEGGEPEQRCPVCDGHGFLNYPKGVARNQEFFTASGSGPWPCHRCEGKGTLALRLPSPEGQHHE